MRQVSINVGGKYQHFQALRYEEDGKKYVAQGTITKPRNIQDEMTITVASKDVFPFIGTPVVCHGLNDSPHNGKIGDLRAWGKDKLL